MGELRQSRKKNSLHNISGKSQVSIMSFCNKKTSFFFVNYVTNDDDDDEMKENDLNISEIIMYYYVCLCLYVNPVM